MDFLFDPIDIGTWTFLNELNLGTNQISKLPDDIACLQNLEVIISYISSCHPNTLQGPR